MFWYCTIFARRTRLDNRALGKVRISEVRKAYEKVYRKIPTDVRGIPGGDWLHLKIRIAKNVLVRPARSLNILRTTTFLKMELYLETLNSF